MVVRNRQRSQFSIVIFVKSIQLFPASFSVTMMTHCSPLLTYLCYGQGEVCHSEQYNNNLTYSSYYQYCSGKFIMILLLCCIHPPICCRRLLHILIMLPLPFVFFFHHHIDSPHRSLPTPGPYTFFFQVLIPLLLGRFYVSTQPEIFCANFVVLPRRRVIEYGKGLLQKVKIVLVKKG